MKLIKRSKTGYSQKVLEDFFRSTLFPSSFFNQPKPVRGVCFAAGPESSEMVRDFAETQLGLGTIGFRLEKTTMEAWREITNLFARPKAEVSKVAFLLYDLDLAAPELQEKIADILDVADNTLWFASVGDHRRLSPKLKLPFLVYLGLGSDNRMLFLGQGVQQVVMDEGTLKNPS